ncbi:MAG: tryptophan synthase subunit alpha [Dysgonamonadaceae bacterium]|jgi:tryptophan synthase alpha chain|nr:tryptophan synthase subunit alpha [Dysgonamonadaceae bacterium]
MNRIKQLFEQKQNNILSVYFTAGYPELNDTTTIIKELEKNGIDLVEIGIPFSDPMADGPVIQESGACALQNGMSLKLLFQQLKAIRREVHIPLILMGYLNPIMQFGFENFCRSCRDTGIDGAILPDLPFDDYIREYKPVADRYDVKIVMLITPETSEERIRLIDEHTDGFIYMVSSAATTGAQNRFDEHKLAYFRRIDAMQLKNPRLIGFGISNRETMEAACAHAGGAIVGSKFISLLKAAPDVASAVVELKNILFPKKLNSLLSAW